MSFQVTWKRPTSGQCSESMDRMGSSTIWWGPEAGSSAWAIPSFSEHVFSHGPYYRSDSVHTQGSLQKAVKLIGLPCSSDGKESACKAGNPGLIPGSERSPGERNGNPLQLLACRSSQTEEPGAWWATVHGVTKSQTQLSVLHGRVVSMIWFSRTSIIFLLCLPYLCIIYSFMYYILYIQIKVLSVSWNSQILFWL